MSPTGSSLLIVQQAATKSLTAITGTMVKNGHSRTKVLSAGCRVASFVQPLMYPILFLSALTASTPLSG